MNAACKPACLEEQFIERVANVATCRRWRTPYFHAIFEHRTYSTVDDAEFGVYTESATGQHWGPGVKGSAAFGKGGIGMELPCPITGEPQSKVFRLVSEGDFSVTPKEFVPGVRLMVADDEDMALVKVGHTAPAVAIVLSGGDYLL